LDKKRRFGLPRFSAFTVVIFLFLALYALSLLFPLGWAFTTSCRDAWDFNVNGGWAWPERWVNNYALAFRYFVVPVRDADGIQVNIGIAQMLGNSVLYAVISAVLSMLTSLLMAYVSARYDFKFCGVIYAVVIVQMILPIVNALPSELKMSRLLGIHDTFFGLWLMKTHVQGLYFLLFYASFKQISKEYTEAARIDGAGHFTIMTRIIFPFVAGTIFTVTLLNFIQYWNDYQTPMMFMPSYPPLAYGLFHFTQRSYELATSSPPLQLAGCMLMAIPLFLLFVIFQHKLLGNISTGGLK
jgi:multiple sugar transport system permease protein